MAQSVEYSKMKQALQKIVIPKLREAGFRGSYPHFRRERENRIDLISFLSHSNSGGAFEVGASIIYLNAENALNSNLFYPDMEIDTKKLTWGHGRIRSCLPGIHGGAFYYVDTYERSFYQNGKTHSHYTAVTPQNEKYLLDELRANHFTLIQKANEDIYSRVALEVSNQMDNLFSWFDRMKTIEELRNFQLRELPNAPQ